MVNRGIDGGDFTVRTFVRSFADLDFGLMVGLGFVGVVAAVGLRRICLNLGGFLGFWAKIRVLIFPRFISLFFVFPCFMEPV